MRNEFSQSPCPSSNDICNMRSLARSFLSTHSPKPRFKHQGPATNFEQNHGNLGNVFRPSSPCYAPSRTVLKSIVSADASKYHLVCRFNYHAADPHFPARSGVGGDRSSPSVFVHPHACFGRSPSRYRQPPARCPPESSLC